MTTDTTGKQQLYRALKRYGALDQQAQDALNTLLQTNVLEKDTSLSSPYAASRMVGFVLEGILRVYHLGEGGVESNKNFFTQDDFFMTSLDESQSASVFVETITRSTVIVFDYEAFLALTSAHQSLEKIFQQILMDYMTQKQRREIELLSLNARERYQMFVRDHTELIPLLPQYHIASYLGITPTQLSRIRKAIASQQM